MKRDYTTIFFYYLETLSHMLYININLYKVYRKCLKSYLRFWIDCLVSYNILVGKYYVGIIKILLNLYYKEITRFVFPLFFNYRYSPNFYNLRFYYLYKNNKMYSHYIFVFNKNLV